MINQSPHTIVQEQLKLISEQSKTRMLDEKEVRSFKALVEVWLLLERLTVPEQSTDLSDFSTDDLKKLLEKPHA